MPQPFRAFVPPPVATEKILLLTSDHLSLAFGVDQVQEILLNAPVTINEGRSITSYRDVLIPVIWGKSSCPAMANGILAVIKTTVVKSGFVAIACKQIPTLVAIDPQVWESQTVEISPWQSDGKVYNFNGITYSHAIGVLRSK